ncbi:MAG: type II secretion system minor pseudopilin GspK [Panacagrimonas sp.]
MTLKPASVPGRLQRGVALITAVLVVSLSVIAATAVLDAGHYAILRTATLQNSELAWWYAAGAEDWVRTALQLDAEDNDYDGLDELWSQPQVFPIDHGLLQGELVDALGRFNLNNLGKSDIAPQGVPQPPRQGGQRRSPESFDTQKRIFLRLIENVGASDLFNDGGEGLADAIRDWIDEDPDPTGTGGKEDLDYQSQNIDPPHLAANRPMSSVTELRAILCALYDCKLDPEVPRRVYELLRPHVTVLPVNGVTPINVNTATPELLNALTGEAGTGQTQGQGRGLQDHLDTRTKEPLESGDPYQELGLDPSEAGTLTIATSLFQLRVTAIVGNAESSAAETSRVALYSLIFRPDEGTPVVLSRSTDTE